MSYQDSRRAWCTLGCPSSRDPFFRTTSCCRADVGGAKLTGTEGSRPVWQHGRRSKPTAGQHRSTQVNTGTAGSLRVWAGQEAREALTMRIVDWRRNDQCRTRLSTRTSTRRTRLTPRRRAARRGRNSGRPAVLRAPTSTSFTSTAQSTSTPTTAQEDELRVTRAGRRQGRRRSPRLPCQRLGGAAMVRRVAVVA